MLAETGHQSRLLSSGELASLSRAQVRPAETRPFQYLRGLLWLLVVAAAATTTAAVQAVAGQSELVLDFRGLKSVSAGRVCFRMTQSSQQQQQQVNLVSLASNHIGSLEANAFECAGSAATLKILILSRNEISKISDLAFNGLDGLQVLLLDDNELDELPSRAALKPLKYLKHLNLANNRIETIPSQSFGFESSNLISVNLRGNPILRLSGGAFGGLSKLKTLTLSQTRLDRLEPLVGLPELRFYHLDGALNLSSVPPDLCLETRKLTALVLRSNQLDSVPQLEQCQNLLQLDLAYNSLSGSIEASAFARLPNLIDLYLGHNQLARLDEGAFAGLSKLQVLELNNNRLSSIHELTFEPLAASLRHLNLANNPQLVQLSPVGLQTLVSFKAFGNPNLRLLPPLRSARRLALTYAYHCCDRQATSSSPMPASKQANNHARDKDDGWRPLGSLLALAERQHRNSSDPELETTTSHADGLLVARWPQVAKARRRRQSQKLPFEGNDDRWQAAAMIDVAQVADDIRKLRAHYAVIAPSDYSTRDFAYFSHLNSSDLSSLKEDTALKQRHPIIQDDTWLLLLAKLTASQFGALDAQQQLAPLGSKAKIKRSDLDSIAVAGQDDAGSPVVSVVCEPKPSPFLPCRDLFDSWWLRLGVWCVFLLGLVGNSMVIVVLGLIRPTSASSALTSIMWLVHSKRHIDVPRFLVINLAFADLLMALYLGALALVDLNTLGQFKLFAIKWQYSRGCQIAGFLAVLSSELSVFILAIITLERNYAITNAVHLNRRLSLQKAILIMSCGYAFALAMALMPLNGVSDYRKFPICLPLDIESSQWSQYYVITLIGMNGLSFLLLLGCYLRMYCAIRGSQAWNANDLRIAKRMSVLVLIDFMCWMPIIVAAIGSLFGHHLVSLQGIKALTIFVLPLNSVANPFLYAITTKKFKRDLDTLTTKMSSLASACLCLGQKSPSRDLDFFYNKDHNQHLAQPIPLIGGQQQQQQQQQLEQQHHFAVHLGCKSNKYQYQQQQFALRKHQAPASKPGASKMNAAQVHRLAAPANYKRFSFGKELVIKKPKIPARGGYDEDDELQVHTPNQVTMNKTSYCCSEARAEADRQLQLQLQPVESACVMSPSAAAVNSSNAQLACCGRSASPPPRPKILLDCSPSLLVHRNCSEIDLDEAQAYHDQDDDNDCNASLNGPDPTPDYTIVRLVESHHSAATTDSQNAKSSVLTVCKQRSKQSKAHLEPRPRSADPNAEQRHLERLVLSACGNNAVPLESRLDNASNLPVKLAPAQQNRCLSALGHQQASAKAEQHQQSSAFGGSHDPMVVARNQQRQFASSTNATCKGSKTRSLNKLTRSITQRLLFSPLAKAWSSIQSISLMQNAQSMQNFEPFEQDSSSQQQQQEQQAVRRQLAKQHHHQNYQPARLQSELGLDQTQAHTEDEDDDDNNDEHLASPLLDYEDFLLISEPSFGLLAPDARLQERRMSRSCDIVPNISELATTTTQADLLACVDSATGEQATNPGHLVVSGGYDDDDTRILLATITRLASKRPSRCKEEGPARYQHLFSGQAGLSRSTRCRSWSPALLSKLETCMHQIRNRIPKRLIVRQQQQQQTGEPACDQTAIGRDQRQQSCQESTRRLAGSKETITGDQVDACKSFSRKSRRGQFRSQARAMQQRQVSVNSDTLSTKTCATTVTNLSSSFDSASNIPATIPTLAAAPATTLVAPETIRESESDEDIL